MVNWNCKDFIIFHSLEYNYCDSKIEYANIKKRKKKRKRKDLSNWTELRHEYLSFLPFFSKIFVLKEKQFNYFVNIFNYDTKLIVENFFSQSWTNEATLFIMQPHKKVFYSINIYN